MEEVVPELCEVFDKKGRKIAPKSKSQFALLNVADAKAAAMRHCPVDIIRDPELNDPSHSLITGYQAYNDLVAEELAKVVMRLYPARP